MTVTDWFPGQGVDRIHRQPRQLLRPGRRRLSHEQPDHRLHSKNEGFAGVIHGTPPGGGATLNLYCIDINTDTWGGIGYALGTWDASNVRNVGYVARILNEYYPNTNQPGLGERQPNGRRRAGGHLVLQRPLRA